MADFVGLDKSVTDLADQCVNANKRQDIADFLVTQQRMIQEGVIAARKENKNAANTSDANNKTKASSAYERMKAMMNGKK